MSTIIRMPEVLAGVTEATIAAWSVNVGDTVAVGAPLAEIETDKALVEYTAEIEGTVLALLASAGESIAVGADIAVVGQPDEAASTGESAATPERAESTAMPAASDEGMDAAAEVRRFVSPLVRRLAKQRGIDLSRLTGTGPNGRIVRRDIDGFADSAMESGAQHPIPVQRPTSAAQPATALAAAPVDSAASDARFDEVPVTRMRQAIARRLTEAKRDIPHFYLAAEVRVGRLGALRDEINATTDVKVSFNDLVVKGVAVAMAAVPAANAVWAGDVIRRHHDVDIAIAVSVDDGLLTPVLRDVGRMTVSGIGRASRDLAERARAGRLRQHELEGGTFSISNLGMYGTREFSAIINPPHSGILAVGAIHDAPVAVDGQVVVEKIMRVTLSADHRVVDGALAAQWLTAFTSCLENPLRLLV